MKRYYTAESEHGSDTSMGFANDTIVKCFDSKASRDAYHEASSNISVIKIKASEATSHAANMSLSGNGDGKPRPFGEEFWGIVNYGPDFYGEESPDGFIGTLEVVGWYGTPESFVVSRFYN